MIKKEFKKNILNWKFFIGILLSIYLIWFLGKEFNLDNWIKLYIYWEISLIKELGFEINFLDFKENDSNNKNTIKINDRFFKIPNFFFQRDNMEMSNNLIKEALIFNKNLLTLNFIEPNRLKMPLSRNLLEKYYN